MKKKPMPVSGKDGAVWQKHKKSLGQNFIMDGELLESLFASTGIADGEYVLEIGAGLGTLTKVLAAHCGKVISIELDRTLIPILNIMFENSPHVQIIHGDALRIDIAELTKGWNEFHVVANIPYYLTTDLVTMLMFSSLPIKSMNLMVQKEAAQRMTAEIGGEGYCLLSLQCRYFGSVSVLREVGRECFDPQPNVDSAFVSVKMHEIRRYTGQEEMERRFFRLCACAFAMRRKTMQNNMMSAFGISREAAGDWLERAGIDKMRRGETVTLEEFYRLTESGPMPAEEK